MGSEMWIRDRSKSCQGTAHPKGHRRLSMERRRRMRPPSPQPSPPESGMLCHFTGHFAGATFLLGPGPRSTSPCHLHTTCNKERRRHFSGFPLNDSFCLRLTIRGAKTIKWTSHLMIVCLSIFLRFYKRNRTNY